MDSVGTAQSATSVFSRLISGSLMVAGTTVGAGMLGIPLVTAQGGFLPAVIVTVFVWIVMLITGLFLLEVSLQMPKNANVLSISEKFLGSRGKLAVGVCFAFLYYCLLVAYFAAGAPLLGSFLKYFSLDIGYVGEICLFTTVFGGIVALGMKWVDRVNIVLTFTMIIAYVALITAGSAAVSEQHLSSMSFSFSFLATPVLFSAFGYHNIIPSLTTYLGGHKKVLQASLVLGTFIALAIYLLWQWLIIGSLPQAVLEEALKRGQPATVALGTIAGKPYLYILGQVFAFFAVTTSLLGVSFSMIDFLGDGCKVQTKGKTRVLLTFFTFLPPLFFVLLDPTIFDRALGIAGGFGEAFLNGLIPVALLYYSLKKNLIPISSTCKALLVSILVFCFFVAGVEFFTLCFPLR